MNTNRNSPIRAVTGAAIAAFVACASTASPAFAMQAPGDGDGTASVSPYAVPIAAIEGMTMAQYVQRHQANNPRTATTV